MNDNFLLKNDVAKKLFFEYAKDMPICDYHCHVNVNEIFEDKHYENLTEVWLAGDHYKWRAMRLNGIDEKYITGNASDYDKFLAYAKTIEVAIGNPLYHWTHLELQRFFGIKTPLTTKTAKEIWDKTSEILQNALTVRKMIEMSNVKTICSTDDPIDDLKFHKALKNEGYQVQVLPTYRPDKAVEIRNANFKGYVAKLSQVCGKKIENIDDLLACLIERLDYFVAAGCKITDHGISYIPFRECDKAKVNEIFVNGLNCEVSLEDEEKYKTYVLKTLANEYCKRNLVMQIHIGATRNNNTDMFNKLGADSGFDAIDDKN
ncbi:MAG: glucuronate isomerase, partial [Clostridia bacterium]